MDDKLIVVYDENTKHKDSPILVAGRRKGRGTENIGIWYGDEAREIYKKLTSLKSERSFKNEKY